MADGIGFLEILGTEMDRQRPDLMPIVEQTLDAVAMAMLAEFENTEDGGSAQQRIIATQVTVAVMLLHALAMSLPKELRTVTVNLIATFALDLVTEMDADDAGSLDVILAEARAKRGGIQ